MSNPPSLNVFQRKPLNQVTTIPDSIISVYVVENHIWADGGSREARAQRKTERRTIQEFLIGPVRSFLNDLFRGLAAPYTSGRKENPLGQGYWIQAEFGSGKSHLLSFIGALALGGEDVWNIVQEKERLAGMGRRESLFSFYENGLAKKSKDSKGILVAVKTLIGQGGGAIGMKGMNRTLAEYVLDAVADQFYLETGRSLPFYPVEILAERFLNTEDFELYKSRLARFLKDSAFFDDEEQEDIQDFLADLQSTADPGRRRDCGDRLWRFYTEDLKTTPQIPIDSEDVLKHMVQRLLDEGYAGLLLILDEVSLFEQGRTDAQRVEDQKALEVLSNRLAKVECLPVWTICAAQQQIESRIAGGRHFIARERLDLVPLLNNPGYYYDIALSRVRTITDPAAVDQYYEDYKRSFSWPQARGKDEFAHFFPFYPPSIDVVRAVSYNLTTVRSALYFMLQALKTQRKRESRELIALWSLFDEVVDYEEDPSGTARSIASVKTKWPTEWKAYETAIHQLDTMTKGPLKVYRNRCEKIIRTLFLYHVANMAPAGLSDEELMNGVMEWKDHDKEQQADLRDNLDHYETLTDKIALELAQVSKVGRNYLFNPTGGGKDPRDHFQKARAEAEGNEVLRNQAWEALLDLEGWKVNARLITIDLAKDMRSIFRDIAPASQTDVSVKWHGRLITGRVFMRDLRDIAARSALLPQINSAETGLDFHVFISSTACSPELDRLVDTRKDGRVLFWSPDVLSPAERSLLLDFTAYRTLVTDFSGRDTQEAKDVLEWVQNRLRADMGGIYRIVPDAYGRGRIAALDHSTMSFLCQGELSAILTPLVGQALDAVYVSKEIEFDAPAPFDDTNAVNVINGVVKVAEIPRGAKPTKDISAAQNYGFALGIMRRPNDRLLDVSQCRYTQDLAEWIENKIGDGGATLPANAIYKNFMGLGGPGGSNYGLSKRMVQLYLCCLARAGKIRIALSGRNIPADAIDYSNIAGIDFKVAVLDAFDQIQRLKPPEGWELLAPYAAVLLEDDAVRAARQDSEIQSAVQRVARFRADEVALFRDLETGLIDLFTEINLVNPLADRLAAWGKFLSLPVKATEPLPFLLNALDEAFGYRVYRDETARQEEVDDLRVRFSEVKQAKTFYRHRDRIRVAARYAAWAASDPALPPDDAALRQVQAACREAGARLSRLGDLMTNETRLLGELLDPMKDAVQSYIVRYLQAFDQVTACAEQARQDIEGIASSPGYRALSKLAQVQQLGSDPCPALLDSFAEIANGPELFPASLTRATVERELRERPLPPDCPLTLANASDWLQRADAAVTRCLGALDGALLERARLIHSPSLRERLAQGREHAFLADLLAAPTAEGVAKVLSDTLGDGTAFGMDPVDLLRRYLKKLRVQRLRLSDFSPSKRTVERGDLDAVVEEFRSFLHSALEAGADELPVVELE
jgi:hypothetical protein